MNMQQQSSGAGNDNVIKNWLKKIEHLKSAEAYVAGASAKYEIQKEIEEAELRLSELMKIGLVGNELGLAAIDADLLNFYFSVCVEHDTFFESHLRGDTESRNQFLVSRGLAFTSPKGAIALTDEGILFCALRELISSTHFHVHVQLQWGEDKLATQEHIWGSVLFLYQELSKRLNELSTRVMGSPERRNAFGSEIAIREYPRVAIIEALTNFLIHRDYKEDDHGRVNVFSDRIEFINPGLSEVSIDDLLSSTVDLDPKYKRNNRLIEVMSLARLNQRKGSGVRRIREALEENGTLLDDGSAGLKLWEDKEKCRFHLVIYRRDLTQLTLNDAPAEPAVASPVFQADITRIIKYAPAALIGREVEIQLINEAWKQAVNGEAKRPHVLTFVALGGEGKTSLVAKWAAELAHDNWLGCEAAFAWSFYSQGTHEAASSDLFLKEALVFFGDEETANSTQSAFDKGRQLARLVGERRALLILDGVEPLQYAPTSPMPGELKDHGIAALLKGLAASSLGLCVVTTRYSISDLKNYWQGNAPEIVLKRLSKEAGVALLKSLGVTGAQIEFEQLVENIQGHALTLNLLGSYLRDAHDGDIRKSDIVKLEDADAEEQGGAAFRLIDATVNWLETGGQNREDNKKGQRALAVLRLMGLFDRPVSADCFYALLKAPVIPNLTELLVDKNEVQRNLAIARLEAAMLLTVNRDPSGTLLSLDAHPLLREYFAKQLREKHPGSWREAHRRLYKHLIFTTNEGEQPTLEDLQPLYQAVVHGCLAGLQQEVCDKVYFARIQRGHEAYSTKKLGALGSDLGAVACFFEQPWSHVSHVLTEADQVWLLNEASFRLRALGRLKEAIEPMQIGMESIISQQNWAGAAGIASNLSEIKLILGEVDGAVRDAMQSLSYADRSGDAFEQVARRTTYADALRQAGRRNEAEVYFREAERMQAEHQPAYPLLYLLPGFRYCDQLLAAPEHAAWLATMDCGDLSKKNVEASIRSGGELLHTEAIRAVSQRATQTLQWAKENNLSLLSIAYGHLTLSNAALCEAILESSSLAPCSAYVKHALDSLRRAGLREFIVRGLLTRAWLRSLEDSHTGFDSAQTDLDEAWEIAERGPMPLFMADIHLYRARLFFREAAYPWESPQADLAEARRLIEKHGYWRRKEELEDAESVILHKP